MSLKGEKHRKKSSIQPPETFEYIVKEKDSLRSIAAHHEVNLSVIKQINKLMSDVVFQDQILYIPSPSYTLHRKYSDVTDQMSKTRTGYTDGQNKSIQTLQPPKPLSVEELALIDEECHHRFVKMKAVYFLKESKVRGVLLVTPDGVMFDPDMDDPLVKEKGPEEFQLVDSIMSVISISVFHNSLLLHHNDNQDQEKKNDDDSGGGGGKSGGGEDCGSGNKNINNSADCINDIDKRKDDNGDGDDDEDVDDDDDSENHSADKLESVIMNIDSKIEIHECLDDGGGGDNDGGGDSSVYCDDNNQEDNKDGDNKIDKFYNNNDNDDDKSLRKKDKMDLKINSDVNDNNDINTTTECSLHEKEETKNNKKNNNNTNNRHDIKNNNNTNINNNNINNNNINNNKEIDSVINVADADNTINTSWRTHESKITSQLNSTLNQSASPNPVHIRLKVHTNIDALRTFKDVGKHKKLQHWFAVPCDRKVDQLYAFFKKWSPSQVAGFDSHESYFVEVEPNTSVSNLIAEVEKDEGSWMKSLQLSKDWQLVSAKEHRRLKVVLEVQQLPLPDLSSPSLIFNDFHVRTLACNLPALGEGMPWTLAYSSDRDGFSLHTLYRKVPDHESILILIIQDTQSHIFGAVLVGQVRVQEHFQGSGESHMFTFYPEFKRFNWTGINNFFFKGNPDSIVIGASEGNNGLWLDAELYHGRTQECHTFDNELLTSPPDFVVKCLEVWTLK